MAIGAPSTLKDTGAVTGSGQTTSVLTSVVIPDATLVQILTAGGVASGTVADPTGVSDGTNNYTKADSAARALGNESEWYFYYAVGGTKTITVTLGTTCNYTHSVAVGETNALAASPLDVVGGGDQGGTTTVTIISVGNVAQNDEVSAIGLMWQSNNALATWPPANYTSIQNTLNATRSKGHASAYRTPLTSAGGQETGANAVILGAATSWTGVLGTYKGAAAAAVIPALVMAPPISA